MTWWSEKLADENRRQAETHPLPPPTIPQVQSKTDTSVEGLVEQAKASVAKLRPAASVAERFGAEPGEGIGTPLGAMPRLSANPTRSAS
jgi:hypothetical protein